MALKRPTGVLASLALHGVIGVLLLQLRHEAGVPNTSNLLYGELVQVVAIADRGAEPAPSADEAEPPSAEPTPQADEPPPAGPDPVAEAPPVPPPPAEPAELVTEPAAPVDAPLEPPAPAVAEAPPPLDDAPAETAPSAAPLEPSEPDVESAVAEDSSPSPEPASDRSVEPAPAERVAIAAPQQEMLAERFADWTGRVTDIAEPATWKHAGHEYSAVFRPEPAEDSMGIDRLIVEISTEHGGKRVTTELTMKRLPFSSFAQFVDRWDPAVQIHDDEIDGRFHSNSEINVMQDRAGRPVFRGLVTTTSRSIRSDTVGRLDRRATFLAGLETGVRRIVMPQRFMPFADGGALPERTHDFATDTRIVFNPDGTYSFSALDSPDSPTVAAIGTEPHYLVAGADAVLHVRGVVKGRVLVYAPKGIVIEDDLTYSTPPPTNPERGDYLGLVSERSIAIAEPEITGPGDLTIHASIFAKRQFVVRDYRSRRSGTLRIFGSVSAGTLSASEPRYATKIEFDERLEHLRAPGFPLTDRYELETWDAVWRPADEG